ncbi:hypothetical protein EBS02_08815, partial [bacterium]|nr:hypothetical protein [bacterium]
MHADQSNQLPVSTLLDDVLISGSTTDHQKLLLICKGLIFFNYLSSDHRVDDVNPDKKINARKFIASALSLFLDEDIDLIKEEDIDLKLISHVESTCWTKLLLKLSKKIDSTSFQINEDILLALYEEAGHVLALLTKKLTTLDNAHQSLINKVLHLMEHNKIYELDKEFFIKISKPLSKNIHQIINYAAFYIETNHVYGIVQFFFSSYFFIDIKQILQESELVRINAAKLIHKVLHFNHNTQPLIASIVHHVLNNYTTDEIYVFFRQTEKPDVHQLLSQIKAPTIKFLQNTEQLHQFKLLLNDFFNKVAKVKNPWFFSQLTLEVLTDCSSDRDLFLLKEHPSQSFCFLESLIPKIHSPKNLERFDVFSVFKSKDLLPMHSPEQLMCFFVIHCSSLIIYDKIASKYNYSGTDHQAIARDINTLYETLDHDVFLIFTLLEINTENKKQLINSCSAFVLKTIPLTLVFNRDGPDAPAQYKADYVRRIAAALFYRREKTPASEKIVNKLSIDLMSYVIQHLLNEENLKALANIVTRPIMQRSRTIFTEYPVVQIDKTIYTAITKMPLHYLLLRNLLNQYLNDIFTAYKEKKI